MRVLFTKRKKFNIVSWLMSKWMKTDYSHVALCFDLFSERLAVDATIKGVRLSTYDNFISKVDIVREIAIYDKEDVKNEAIRYCLSNMGDHYSSLSILGILLRNKLIGKDGEQRFICSELLARAFNLKHKNLDQITVKELEDLIEATI